MSREVMMNKINKLIAGTLLSIRCFLLPVENAFSVSNFNFTPIGFSSADTAPSKSYMDSAGTWNNALNGGLGDEVTDTTGDTFTFIFTNNGPDTAYDFDLNISVPTGFRLPSAITSVDVTSLTPAIPGCATLTNVPLNQAVPGDPIEFNFTGNNDIPDGCSYRVILGLTTNDAVPFAVPSSVSCPVLDPGCHDVTLNVNYDESNVGPPSSQTQSTSRLIDVRTADVLLTKTS